MRTLLLAVGLSATAAVAAAQVPQRLPPRTTVDTFANVVTVQNNRPVPVTVYLDYGQFDRRLGIVPATTTQPLPLPKWAVNQRREVRLFARPDGEAQDLATQTVKLAPPGLIGFIVPPRGAMPEATTPWTEFLPPEMVEDATLTVDNPGVRAVTVFAAQGPFDVRLGRVDARGKATFRFPTSVVGTDRKLRVFLHPDGGADLESQALQVRKGEHLGIRVPGM